MGLFVPFVLSCFSESTVSHDTPLSEKVVLHVLDIDQQPFWTSLGAFNGELCLCCILFTCSLLQPFFQLVISLFTEYSRPVKQGDSWLCGDRTSNEWILSKVEVRVRARCKWILFLHTNTVLDRLAVLGFTVQETLVFYSSLKDKLTEVLKNIDFEKRRNVTSCYRTWRTLTFIIWLDNELKVC